MARREYGKEEKDVHTVRRIVRALELRTLQFYL